MLDESYERKMDGEASSGKQTSGLSNGRSEYNPEGHDKAVGVNNCDDVEIEGFSDEWQCMGSGVAQIGALAPKRAPGDDAGDGARDNPKARMR